GLQQCVAELKGHTSGITSVSFNPNGTWLISGSYDQTVRLWDVLSRECLAELEGFTTSVSFSPDGYWLASGGETVQLWDVVLQRCVTKLQSHIGSVDSVSFSPDGHWLASGGEDQTIFLWKRLKSAKQEQWLLEYRFVTAFILFIANAHFNGAELSA